MNRGDPQADNLCIMYYPSLPTGGAPMKTRSLGSLILGISFIALTILSCSSPLELFASPTPTPTNTQTPTITNTPTATPVPPPPFTITSCVFQDDCPEANLFTTYLQADIANNVLTQVVFPYSEKVRLNIGWCTKDETSLDLNIQHISYIFEIDGVSYLDLATVKHGNASDNNDPSIQNPCVFIGAMLSDFQIGEDHQVTIGYRFDAEIFDGWNSYAPFTNAYILDLKPEFLPTATPTPTLTPTSTPRPLPTIPYNTPAPACDASSSITITNDTGGTVSLYLNGPANFEFELGTGDTTLSVCPGDYSYTAYGCGGASDSGSMSSGESHRFFCQ